MPALVPLEPGLLVIVLHELEPVPVVVAAAVDADVVVAVVVHNAVFVSHNVLLIVAGNQMMLGYLRLGLFSPCLRSFGMIPVSEELVVGIMHNSKN